MTLKEVIADLENREVEDVCVAGKHNKYLASRDLTRFKEAFTDCYLEEMEAEVLVFFGITYVRIDDDESHIKEIMM